LLDEIYSDFVGQLRKYFIIIQTNEILLLSLIELPYNNSQNYQSLQQFKTYTLGKLIRLGHPKLKKETIPIFGRLITQLIIIA